MQLDSPERAQIFRPRRRLHALAARLPLSLGWSLFRRTLTTEQKVVLDAEAHELLTEILAEDAAT
jgi:hypothetical protein